MTAGLEKNHCLKITFSDTVMFYYNFSYFETQKTVNTFTGR